LHRIALRVAHSVPPANPSTHETVGENRSMMGQ
jgi:hypothetical protein